MKHSTELEGQVEHNIVTRRLFRRGQAILVAVSGGLDSMVLLRLLHTLAPRHGWKLTVAHLNHQLRGSSSRADERLVHATAEALGLPAIIERADVRRFARAGHLSLEMAARELRHRFLARAAAQSRISVAALAHQADDQLELFFLRLFRGSGGEGLAGMKWQSLSPVSRELKLARPLLDVSKTALYLFAEEQRVKYREDATNRSLEIPRNRIRGELLPLLRRRYQPGLDKTVLRAMEIIGAEAEVVTEQATRWLEDLDGGEPGRPDFEALPVAIQRRCIQLQLLRLAVPAEFDCIETLRLKPGQLVALGGAAEPPSSDRAAGQQLFVLRDGQGRMHLHRQSRAGFDASLRELALGQSSGAREVVFDGVRLQWRTELKRGAQRAKARPNQEVFDADKVGSAVKLRHWQPGDRFQPIGLLRPVKLQDLFVNQKIPRPRRHQLLVAVTAQGAIFWVEGLRLAEPFKLTPHTIRRLHWHWRRL